LTTSEADFRDCGSVFSSGSRPRLSDPVVPIEGAWKKDGRAPCIRDTVTHNWQTTYRLAEYAAVIGTERGDRVHT
jgi:hypothetical protein